MEAIQIWRTAGALVAQHGADEAVFKAASQADRYRAQGNSSLALEWLRVLDAVEEFVRSPDACEVRH